MTTAVWRCPACEASSLVPRLCPNCLARRQYVTTVEVPGAGAVPLSLVKGDDLARVGIPGFPSIETAMAGGFVRGSVTLLYGAAGLGKTRLGLLLADQVCRRHRKALYISTEQTPQHLRATAMLVGIGESPLPVAYAPDPDAVARLLREDPAFAVVDSLHALHRNDESTLVQVVLGLVSLAREMDTALLLVGHETKDGDYFGSRAIEHYVDAVVRLDTPSTNRLALLWVVRKKYRFGPVGREALLRLHDDGRITDAALGMADPRPSA